MDKTTVLPPREPTRRRLGALYQACRGRGTRGGGVGDGAVAERGQGEAEGGEIGAGPDLVRFLVVHAAIATALLPL